MLRDVFVYGNYVGSCRNIGILVSNWLQNGPRRNISVYNNTVEYNRIGIDIQTRNVEDIRISWNTPLNTVRNNSEAGIKIWDTTYSNGAYGIWFNASGTPTVFTQ